MACHRFPVWGASIRRKAEVRATPGAIGLVISLALSILLVAFSSEAQQPAKVPRVGMLLGPSRAAAAANIEAFRQGLRELGYVEGQNIAVELRFGEGKVDLLPDLAAELVRLRADVIVTWGTPAAGAAKKATSTIPIVMAAAVNPVGTGLVASLARPGGNITGLSSGFSEMYGKTLELLKEVVPRVPRIGVLWNPDNPATTLGFKETQAAARTLRVKLQPLEVRDPTEFEGAFAAMIRERAGALQVIHELMFFTHRQRIVELVAKNRLPAVYARREYVDAGGLMSYGVNFRDNFRRAAAYVDKILKGANPADLPVEQPTRFELVINLKTAKALGLTIPQSVLFRADHVIQ